MYESAHFEPLNIWPQNLVQENWPWCQESATLGLLGIYHSARRYPFPWAGKYFDKFGTLAPILLYVVINENNSECYKDSLRQICVKAEVCEKADACENKSGLCINSFLLMGHSKNNETNVLQNGPKIIYVWYISASCIGDCNTDNEGYPIFFSCLIIFGMTLIWIFISNINVIDCRGMNFWKVFEEDYHQNIPKKTPPTY